MRRFASKELDNWLEKPNRKPMVLRGAGQVGKTWVVRNLAKRQKLKLMVSIYCP
jgi:predicted AAA+ superfamily ATPase